MLDVDGRGYSDFVVRVGRMLEEIGGDKIGHVTAQPLLSHNIDSDFHHSILMQVYIYTYA